MSCPRGMGSGILAEQHADEILLLRDLTLQLGHSRHGLLVLRFGLPVVALRHRTFVGADSLQLCGLAQTLRRLSRDLELAIQCAQLDVAGGDGRDDGQHDRAFALLTGEQTGPSRLRRAPQPAPDIELEARRKIHAEVVEQPAARTAAKGGRFAQLLSLRCRSCVQLWKLRRVHDAILRSGPIDVGGRDLDVLVVGERCPYKARKDLVIELIPPGDVRDLAWFGGAEPPGGGYRDLGALVVGTDHAAGQGHGQQQR